MSQRKKLPTIHRGKAPIRKHYIAERAERLGLKQADFVEQIGADKSTVSRWFDGVIPTDEYIEKVAFFLQCEDVRELFQDPGDDWMARMLKGREQDEVERIRSTIEAAFPRRSKA